MGKANTIFEQIPVDVVKKIATRDDDGGSPTVLASCAICGRHVQLEHCKTNEDGDAVHEECYAATITPGKNGKLGSQM